jgi:hypothetical protein
VDKKTNFKNITLSLLLIIASAWFIIWIVFIIKNIGLPQIDYSEGFNMWNAKTFGAGNVEWDALVGPPFKAYFYTPIWYMVMGQLINVFGDSLIVGRIFNIITMLACMSIVFLIVNHLTKSKIIALISAFFPLMTNVMVSWSMFIRVDLTAIFFELAGIYMVIRFKNSHWLYLSIPLFILAIFTKQSILAGAGAACLYLFLEDWRSSISYIIAFIIGIVACLALAFNLTNGEFLNQIFFYQQSPWNSLNNVLFEIYRVIILIVPIAMLGLTYTIKNLKSVVAIYVIVAVLLNTFTLFHTGGNTNYFFETIFALSLASGILLKQVIDKKIEIYIWMFIFSIYGIVTMTPNISFENENYIKRYDQAKALIQDAAYPILTENAQLVLDAGKEPYYEPFVYNNMASLKYFDEQIVVNDLEENRIEYVITEFKLPYTKSQRFNDTVQKTILDNYHLIMDAPKDSNSVFDFVVYEANNK